MILPTRHYVGYVLYFDYRNEGVKMEPFIRHNQVIFIEKQMKQIIDGQQKHLPKSVMRALTEEAHFKIEAQFIQLTEEQRQLIDFTRYENKEMYLEQIKACELDFPVVTLTELKKLLPKYKKLKVPEELAANTKRSYLGFDDVRSHQKVIVAEIAGELCAIAGHFIDKHQKNICAFCGCTNEVVYFTAKTHARDPKNPDYYKTISHLICKDSEVCNAHLTDLTKLHDYMEEVLKK